MEKLQRGISQRISCPLTCSQGQRLWGHRGSLVRPLRNRVFPSGQPWLLSMDPTRWVSQSTIWIRRCRWEGAAVPGGDHAGASAPKLYRSPTAVIYSTDFPLLLPSLPSYRGRIYAGGKPSLGSVGLALFPLVCVPGWSRARVYHHSMISSLIPAYQPPPQERGPIPTPKAKSTRRRVGTKPWSAAYPIQETFTTPWRTPPVSSGVDLGLENPIPKKRNLLRCFRDSRPPLASLWAQKAPSGKAAAEVKAPMGINPAKGNSVASGTCAAGFGDIREDPRCSWLSQCPGLGGGG